MLMGSFIILLPEIILSVFSMLLLIVGVFSKKEFVGVSILWTTSAILFVSSIGIFLYQPAEISALENAYILDDFARFLKFDQSAWHPISPEAPWGTHACAVAWP